MAVGRAFMKAQSVVREQEEMKTGQLSAISYTHVLSRGSVSFCLSKYLEQ